MEHLKPDFVLLGIILVFSGCIHVANVPQIPTLIVPEDGAVFEAEPPTFIWTSDSLFLADAYVIMIFKDSLRSEDTLVYETLEDTTYTMPTEVFDSADSGTYCWVAAVHWIDGNVETTAHGDPRTFVIKKSESPAGLDLDTTYFPFGLGYEWCYRRHYHGYENYEPFSEYDTVTIRVNDSFWIYDTMKFGFDHFFYDLTNPVSIINDSIILYMSFMTYDFEQPISLVEQPEIDDLLSYQDDIMIIAAGDFTELSFAWTEVKRRKGIGAFSMLSQSTYVDPYAYDYNVDYHLLYFYNGQDTVYKAD